MDSFYKLAVGSWRLAVECGCAFSTVAAATRLFPPPSLSFLSLGANGVMSQSNYRQLVVWQKSRVLARELYRATRQFPRDEMFGLVQQMRRAVVSVASNIAEAHGRESAPDRIRHLVIARGSLLELETQVVIAMDLKFVNAISANQLEEQTTEVARLLNGLLRHYQKKLREGTKK
jgi:four helix bundle protein